MIDHFGTGSAMIVQHGLVAISVGPKAPALCCTFEFFFDISMSKTADTSGESGCRFQCLAVASSRCAFTLSTALKPVVSSQYSKFANLKQAIFEILLNLFRPGVVSWRQWKASAVASSQRFASPPWNLEPYLTRFLF